MPDDLASALKEMADYGYVIPDRCQLAAEWAVARIAELERELEAVRTQAEDNVNLWADQLEAARAEIQRLRGVP